MLSERDLQINPLVQDSIAHNTKVLSNLQNLTASLFGVGAGILGLESYHGFIFYLVFSLITSALVYAFRVLPGVQQQASRSKPTGKGIEHGEGVGRYFRGGLELWTGGLLDGLTGFVLTWTLFYGIVRA